MKTARTTDGYLTIMPEHDDDKDIINDLEDAFKDRVIPFSVWIKDFLNPGLKASKFELDKVELLHYIIGPEHMNLILRTVRQAGVSTALACYALYRALFKADQTVVLSCLDFVMSRFMLDKLELLYEALGQAPKHTTHGYYLPKYEVLTYEDEVDSCKQALQFDNGSRIVVAFRNSHFPDKADCVMADDYAYYDEDRGLRLLDLATKMTEGVKGARIVLASSLHKDNRGWFDKLFYDLREDDQWHRETCNFMDREDLREHVYRNVITKVIPHFMREYVCRTKYDSIELEEQAQREQADIEHLQTTCEADAEAAAEAAAECEASTSEC